GHAGPYRQSSFGRTTPATLQRPHSASPHVAPFPFSSTTFAVVIRTAWAAERVHGLLPAGIVTQDQHGAPVGRDTRDLGPQLCHPGRVERPREGDARLGEMLLHSCSMTSACCTRSGRARAGRSDRWIAW